MTIPKYAPLLGEWSAPCGAFLARRAELKGARWFAYQCRDLYYRPVSHMGDVTYLACGPDCTYKEPPPFCPGPNVWHAMSPLIGKLDLNTGALIAEQEDGCCTA